MSLNLNIVLNFLTIVNQDAVINHIVTILLPVFDCEEVPTEAGVSGDPMAGALTCVTTVITSGREGYF